MPRPRGATAPGREVIHMEWIVLTIALLIVIDKTMR